MDRFRVVFLIVVILIVLFGPEGSTPGKSRHAEELVAHEKQQLDALRNSTFGYPGNVTGLLPEGPTPPGSVRDRWQAVREKILGAFARVAASEGWVEGSAVRTRAVRREQRLPMYSNATGLLYGRWRKLDMPELRETAANGTYDRNVTMERGKITFSIQESKDLAMALKEVREVGAVASLKDPDGGNDMNVAFHGVHFSGSGEMVMTTTSERFAGLFALPHFTRNEATYSQSKEMLLDYIAGEMKKAEDDDMLEVPWRSSSDGAAAPTNPKCEYIAYVQLHPVGPPYPPTPEYEKLVSQGSALTPDVLRSIEHELRFPSGVPLPAPPPIIATAMIYSPTCGFALEADEMVGQRLERLYGQISHFGLATAVVTALQIWLLIRQMNETNTPSTVSRVSFWTVALMSVVDGYALFAFMIASLFLHMCFLPLITASFCFLILLTMFEMRFLVTTYRVQRPERRAATTTPSVTQAPTPAPTPAPPPGELPLPATAIPQTATTLPGDTPAPAPANAATNTATTTTGDGDDDIRSEIGTLHTRFYFTLLATLFFTLHAASWPPFYRNIFIHTTLLISNSYWVPQIYRNIHRGCRKAFRWEFVFGTSFCRVLFSLYLYVYRANVFHLEPNPRAAAVVIGWVWLQCMALLSQEMFGPRFLIPQGWLPPVYDYHSAVPLADDDEEARGEEEGAEGRRTYDCAICMQSVEVPLQDEAGGGASAGGTGRGLGVLGRRGYMVTPCRHVFHSNCLEGWMRFRLQCPICRNSLPPL